MQEASGESPSSHPYQFPIPCTDSWNPSTGIQQKARLHGRQGRSSGVIEDPLASRKIQRRQRRSIGVRNDLAASEESHWRQKQSSGVRENPAASGTTLGASKTVPAATRTTPVAPETTTSASGKAIGIRKDPAAPGKIQRRQERSSGVRQIQVGTTETTSGQLWRC